MNTQGKFHGKQRRWHAYISVAASGEDLIPPRPGSSVGYPKAFSKLEYASNDIDYWANSWTGSHPAQPDRTIHKVIHNANFAAVQVTFEEVREWFSHASEHPDFDGGMLVFTYSGHGRDKDGALCLNENSHFGADDFIKACLEIKNATSSERRLKLAIFLDSCYSGVFLLNVLEKALHEYGDILYPDYFFAASMPDEQAWEVSSLEHGLATHSRILQARIEDPEEEWIWPHHPVYMDRHLREMVVGAVGCSYATGGAQNPFIFDEHDFEILGNRIEVWTDYDYENGLRPRQAWEADLLACRDLFRASIAELTHHDDFDGNFSDPVEVDFHNRSYAKNNPSAKAGFDRTTTICFRGCGQSVLSVLQNVRSSDLDVKDIEKIEKACKQVLAEVAMEDPDKGVIVRQLTLMKRFLVPLTNGENVPYWLADAMRGKKEPCDPALGCESCLGRTG